MFNFNVIFESKVYHVYSVKVDKKGTYFLLFISSEWVWVNCNDCKPLNILKEDIR